MVALIADNDEKRMNKIARVKICEVCPLMSDIGLVCAACNCTGNKQIFIYDNQHCPRGYWTQLN